MRAENGMGQISSGFIARPDRITNRHGTRSEPGNLRKNEPHPVSAFRTRPKLRQSGLVGITLRCDEPLEIVRIARRLFGRFQDCRLSGLRNSSRADWLRRSPIARTRSLALPHCDRLARRRRGRWILFGRRINEAPRLGFDRVGKFSQVFAALGKLRSELAHDRL